MTFNMMNRSAIGALCIALLSVAGCRSAEHTTHSQQAGLADSTNSAPPTQGGENQPQKIQEVHPHAGSNVGEAGGFRDVDLEEVQSREPEAQAKPRGEPPIIEEIMPNPDDAPPPSRTGDTSTTTNAAKSRTVKRTVPGTAVGYEMVQIPAGKVRVIGDDGQETTVEVGPFWIGKTELPWEMYDIYVFNLDEQGVNEAADAVSRPSRPYIPPDRGFGHAGYPAISMTTQGATKFCEWLSAKTGRKYRLPTVAEWRYAALAGSDGQYAFGDPAHIDDYAWTENNSPEKTQPIGQKKPNAFGLLDVHGNVMEWCRTMDSKGDGEGFVACGGSFYSTPEDSTAFSAAEQDWSWQMTDPQIPKSPWWMSDASWVGMRILCEDETVNAPEEDKP